MNGLVLLDEEQQAALYGRQQQQQQQQRRALANNATTLSNGSSLPRRGSAGEPRTDFTTGPRTDFTTGGGYHEPRTDFTTAGTQGPRTNFLTNPSLAGHSGGKPSIATFNSSPRTNFTTNASRPAPPQQDPNAGLDGSYPMLRRMSDDAASSSDETDGDGVAADRYAGASSGLKISVTLIMIGVVLGLVLGVILAQVGVSPLVARWVNLPGELFLRALKCLVLPYVFCSVAVAVGDIVFVGKVSVIGVQTIRVFAVFWVTSTLLGTGLALLFRPLFRLDRTAKALPLNSIGFECANKYLLSVSENNTLSCSGNTTISGALTKDTAFTVHDINNIFQKNVKGVLTQLSLSSQLMQTITSFVSSNIFQTMAKSELLAVITFAMVLGAIAGRNYFTKTRRVNYLYLLLLQLRNTFFLAMEWVIWLTPVAVISIIAGSFATNQESMKEFGKVYMYVVAVFTGVVVQMGVLIPFLVFLLTRCNPYNHMRKMARAYIFAFACSSSLATAPVTLTCVKKAKVCSQSLANFVISIGVSSNLSGMGIYAPIGVIFLAESSGVGDQITILRIIGIFALCLIACAGTPPIPASGLVTISTIYTTMFNVSEVPATFPYIVAMDFFVDRITTVCNTNDDIMALKVIAENTDETVTQEQLGERY